MSNSANTCITCGLTLRASTDQRKLPSDTRDGSLFSILLCCWKAFFLLFIPFTPNHHPLFLHLSKREQEEEILSLLFMNSNSIYYYFPPPKTCCPPSLNCPLYSLKFPHCHDRNMHLTVNYYTNQRLRIQPFHKLGAILSYF